MEGTCRLIGNTQPDGAATSETLSCKTATLNRAENTIRCKLPTRRTTELEKWPREQNTESDETENRATAQWGTNPRTEGKQEPTTWIAAETAKRGARQRGNREKKYTALRE